MKSRFNRWSSAIYWTVAHNSKLWGRHPGNTRTLPLEEKKKITAHVCFFYLQLLCARPFSRFVSLLVSHHLSRPSLVRSLSLSLSLTQQTHISFQDAGWFTAYAIQAILSNVLSCSGSIHFSPSLPLFYSLCSVDPCHQPASAYMM